MKRRRRPIPLSFILLLATAVHLPLMLMKLPLKSYDTNFHIFFASHYLHHWFDPWNPKWYAGFSQTTYPPLPQQWVAVLSHDFRAGNGLHGGAVCGHSAAGGGRLSLSLAVGEPAGCIVSRPWRAVFLGSESFLVYSAGQLGTTAAAPIYLNALPFLVRVGPARELALLSQSDRAVHRRGHGPPRHAALRLVLLCPAGSGAGVHGPRRRRATSTVPSFVVRSVSITVVTGGGHRHRPAALLDRIDSLPGHADADPASQPRQLHPQPAMGPELFCRSLWRHDSGSAVHLLARLHGAAAAALAASASGWRFCSDWEAQRPSAPSCWGALLKCSPWSASATGPRCWRCPLSGLLAAELVDRITASRAVVGLSVAAALTCGLAVAWSTYRPADGGTLGLPSMRSPAG